MLHNYVFIKYTPVRARRTAPGSSAGRCSRRQPLKFNKCQTRRCCLVVVEASGSGVGAHGSCPALRMQDQRRMRKHFQELGESTCPRLMNVSRAWPSLVAEYVRLRSSVHVNR